MGSTPFLLFPGQVLRWINGLTVPADFEVQQRTLTRPLTHSRDLLPGFHPLAFSDQQEIIVAIGTEIIRIVFNDHELSVTGQTTARVNNLAARGGSNILADPAADMDSRLGLG